MPAPLLFTPLALRGLVLRNRIFVSPMCQYSAVDGLPNDWHLVHLGARAVGGAALVCVEATAVAPEGRISPFDTGLWTDEQARAFAPIAAFIRRQGAAPAIQLAHAGRKASTDVPWRGGRPLTPLEGGWQPIAASPLPFSAAHPVPREMDEAAIDRAVAAFVAAAHRARSAGFEVIEIHAAHGYLLHGFLSPLANRREDEYGGPLENRARLLLRVARDLRAAWPEDRPVFVRISATDWAEGGFDLAEAVRVARWLREAGIDLITCSSGGLVPDAKVPLGPGYQVPLAAAVRREAGIATGAVGLIREPYQAEQILATGEATAVVMAREFLRDPHWPLRAARALGADIPWPAQYLRAKE